MKNITVTIYPEDVVSKSPIDLTFEQARAFLDKHREAIKDAMTAAANDAIEDILSTEEVLL